MRDNRPVDIASRIDELWASGEIEAAPIEEAIRLLDAGEIRVAEPVAGGWQVNEWVKKAILLYFRLRKVEPMEVGGLHFLDKIPVKSDYADRGVRVVPPGVARYGSFLSEGCVLMPGYVNIGAWVGPRTMVDTWATVGSCAQIGADVHLAGGVGIGGVLEPPQAAPVIVEDGAFIGSRAVVVEGVRIGAGAVIAPNVVLSASIPDHRRHRTEACRAPRRGATAQGRAPGRTGKGVSRRVVQPPVRADRRRSQRLDRPEDVVERRAARIRHRGLDPRQGSVRGALCRGTSPRRARSGRRDRPRLRRRGPRRADAR